MCIRDRLTVGRYVLWVVVQMGTLVEPRLTVGRSSCGGEGGGGGGGNANEYAEPRLTVG